MISQVFMTLEQRGEENLPFLNRALGVSHLFIVICLALIFCQDCIEIKVLWERQIVAKLVNVR